jgi:hypothetical protein
MPAFSCERVWVKDMASILRKLSIPSLDKAFMSALEHGGTVPYWKNNNCQKKSWYPRRIGYAIKHMGMGQNHVALVNIKIGGKWMFIP